MLAFAMISQRRILSLIHLFTLQGATLVLSTVVVAYVTNQPHLYVSAGVTLVLKVLLIPYLLHRVIDRLEHPRGCRDADQHPDDDADRHRGRDLRVQPGDTRSPGCPRRWPAARWASRCACVLLSFLMMITRAKAVPQVIGFLAMENGLFFAATSATYGMPMVVEFGIALDVLIGVLILGVFMFQIREQFDSLDIRHLEKLKED